MTAVCILISGRKKTHETKLILLQHSINMLCYFNFEEKVYKPYIRLGIRKLEYWFYCIVGFFYKLTIHSNKCVSLSSEDWGENGQPLNEIWTAYNLSLSAWHCIEHPSSRSYLCNYFYTDRNVTVVSQHNYSDFKSDFFPLNAWLLWKKVILRISILALFLFLFLK